MQNPDPKCRHFVISWHFMAFWHVCQKANCITKSAFSAFSAFSCLFLPFRLFHQIRLLDFSALVRTRLEWADELLSKILECFDCFEYKSTGGAEKWTIYICGNNLYSIATYESIFITWKTIRWDQVSGNYGQHPNSAADKGWLHGIF